MQGGVGLTFGFVAIHVVSVLVTVFTVVTDPATWNAFINNTILDASELIRFTAFA